MPAMQRSRRLSPVPLVLVALLALAFGIWLGGHPSNLPAFVRTTLVPDSQGRLYQEAVGHIQSDYYRKVDPNQLLDTSLSAAVASLHDQYSRYLSPSGYAGFSEENSGRFTGIGITIAPDKRKRGVVVRQVFACSPAKQAGLARGDVIVQAGARTLKGATLTAAGSAIRGKEGTGVRLTWISPSGRVTKVVERRQVDVPIVQSKLERFRGRPIAWVRLAQFTDGSGAEVGTAVRKLLGKGAKGVVLDLRGNPGGLLDESVATASAFLPEIGRAHV